MASPRESLTAALALSAAALLTACAGPSASPQPSSTSTPWVQSSPDPGDDVGALIWEAAGSGDPRDSPIDEFWRAALADTAIDYRTPAALFGYQPGEVPPVACAAHRPAESWRDGAFYCQLDETISYDIGFLRNLHEDVGPLAPIGILAHEWGHHIQALAGSGEFDIQDELMADCFAGMYASEQDPANADVEDSSLVMVAFFTLGNEQYRSSSWFQSLEHGAPGQRAAAWSLGYLTVGAGGGAGVGYDTCRGYAAWKPGQTVEVGDFRLVELPGRTGAVEGGVYELAPEDADGLPGLSMSAVEIQAVPDDAPLDRLWTLLASRWAGMAVQAAPVELAAQPDAGAVYFALDRDPATEGFEKHGFAGLYTTPNDPAAGLLAMSLASESLSSFDAPTPDELAAATALVNHGLIVMGRICPPHHSAEPGTSPDRYNQYCAADL